MYYDLSPFIIVYCFMFGSLVWDHDYVSCGACVAIVWICVWVLLLHLFVITVDFFVVSYLCLWWGLLVGLGLPVFVGNAFSVGCFVCCWLALAFCCLFSFSICLFFGWFVGYLLIWLFVNCLNVVVFAWCSCCICRV